MALATSSLYILVLTSAAGAANGLITPSINVLITQRVPVRLRGLAFGIKTGAAPGAAALAALGGWMTTNLHAPWQVLFWACAGVGCVVLSSTLLIGRGARGKVIVDAGRRTLFGLKTRRPLILLAIGGLLATSGTSVFAPFGVDGLIDHGLAPGTATSVLALSSCLGLVSRVVVGGLSDRWPDPFSHLWAVVGMLTVSVASTVFLAFGGVEFMLIAAMIAAFTIGWAWPGLIHYAVIATHANSPALATSYMQSGTFAGAVLGPLGFGLLADYVSFTAAWIAAGLTVLVAVLFLTAGVRSLRRNGAEDHLVHNNET
jgi:MFS family permease